MSYFPKGVKNYLGRSCHQSLVANYDERGLIIVVIADGRWVWFGFGFKWFISAEEDGMMSEVAKFQGLRFTRKQGEPILSRGSTIAPRSTWCTIFSLSHDSYDNGSTICMTGTTQNQCETWCFLSKRPSV